MSEDFITWNKDAARNKVGIADVKPVLCSRCGSFSRNFNRSKVFLIFFCALG